MNKLSQQILKTGRLAVKEQPETAAAEEENNQLFKKPAVAWGSRKKKRSEDATGMRQ